MVIHCENAGNGVKHSAAHFAEYFSYCRSGVTQLWPGGARPCRARRLTAWPAGRNTAAASRDLPVQVACFRAGWANKRMRTDTNWTARKGAFRTVTAHAQNLQANHRGLRNPLWKEVQTVEH